MAARIGSGGAKSGCPILRGWMRTPRAMAAWAKGMSLRIGEAGAERPRVEAATGRGVASIVTGVPRYENADPRARSRVADHDSYSKGSSRQCQGRGAPRTRIREAHPRERQ